MNTKLANGYQMPLVGLGCSVFPEPAAIVEESVVHALQIGYRHFDTATLYNTEVHLGNALKKGLDAGTVKREDLFIVTKLPQTGMKPELVSRFANLSLKNLQLDYIDLYLIHWPFGMVYRGNDADVFPMDDKGNYLFDPSTDIEAVWKGMEKLVESGKVKSIGLSNFNEKQIERILKIAKIPPVNNQVELHAYLQQPELREFCEKRGISLTAYFPIGGQARKNYPDNLKYKTTGHSITINVVPPLLEDSLVLSLAKKYNRTPAQILLRFTTQLTPSPVAVIPKSSNPNRLMENFKINEFTLEPEDMEQMRKLDQGEAGRSCFCWPGAETHPEYPFSHSNFIDPPSSSS